jgi:hypothetical protein
MCLRSAGLTYFSKNLQCRFKDKNTRPATSYSKYIACPNSKLLMIKRIPFLAALAGIVLLTSYCSTSSEVDLCDSGPALSVVAKEEPTTGSSNGSIEVKATGGVSPYIFSINDGGFQADSTFNDLGAGNYIITVRDALNCLHSLSVSLAAVDPCSKGLILKLENVRMSVGEQNNGQVVLMAVAGLPPYQYQMEAMPFQSANTFSSLMPGTYSFAVRDAVGCVVSQSVEIRQVPLVLFSTQVKPIIDTNCQVSGCHGDRSDLPSWNSHGSIAARAADIRHAVVGKSMPPESSGKTLSGEQIEILKNWVDQGSPDN